MKPNILPPAGSRISGLTHAMGLVQRVAERAGAEPEVGGPMGYEQSSLGPQIIAPDQPAIQCFQLKSGWCNVNPPPHAGPSTGDFWFAQALPMTYVWHQNLASCWRCAKEGRTRIFTSEGDKPTAEDGDQVWCIWDRQASVWRVISTPTGSSPPTRYGILRCDLLPGGSTVIEEYEWIQGDSGYPSRQCTGRTYRAYRTEGDFYGIADEACVEWHVSSDANAPQSGTDLDAMGFTLPDGCAAPSETQIAVLDQITCVGFVCSACGVPVT